MTAKENIIGNIIGNIIAGAFPAIRMRRLRQAGWIRSLAAETRLTAADLIWPLFVCEGDEEMPVASMPGVNRFPVARAAEMAVKAQAEGIPAVALFPFTPAEKRSENGEEALNPDNLVCRAVRAVKQAAPDIGIMCDVALDPYTSHGHDGIMRGGQILNDESVAILVKQALNQARAGCTIIAPSDMMDGRVGAIRAALEKEGLRDVLIMSYAAKYASALYSPFRDAVGAAGVLRGDKKTYQMDPANVREALREIALDIEEGADMVMVKPAGFYLDVIAAARTHFPAPLFAYQVSGEYAMIVLAAQNGAFDRETAMIESLLACKRAGATGILTYFALEAARFLNAQ